LRNPIVAKRSFQPDARTWNLIILLGAFALGWAVYMRYALVEQSAVGLACVGMETAMCESRAVVIRMFGWSVFGVSALILAVVQFIRPSVPVFILGVMAAGIGVVMYNNNLASLAAGLLVISLARPWRSATA